MTCHEYEDDLGDYVDRALPPARTTVIEAHLTGCNQCGALATDFRTLRSVAAGLERRTPPEHVWTQLAARLHREETPLPLTRMAPAPVRGWRPLLASVLMLALLAGASWFAWREVSTARSTESTDAGLRMPPAPGMEALDSEILHLKGIVNAGAEVLPGETKAAYQASDAVIDHAIGQSRAVLATEPMDNLAQQSLFEATRSKLVLLQDMVALINEMRKGNQDAAARIVSGMEP